MQYGLTANVIKRAKLSKLPPGYETDYRFVWEVNYKDVCGKKIFIATHADTRYSMVYTNIKPSVWKNLDIFMHEVVSQALIGEGIYEEDIHKYFAASGPGVLTKTHGKIALGGMNRVLSDLPYMDKILVDDTFQSLITDSVNHTICSIATHPEKGYTVPKEFFRERILEVIEGE